MAAVCRDTPNWNNGPRPGGPLACTSYRDKGYCRHRRLSNGYKWTGGERFNYPEFNCCICGGGTMRSGRSSIQSKSASESGSSTVTTRRCRCPGISMCSNYSMAAALLRMPDQLVDAASPWYGYLSTVYRSTALPLPLALGTLEAFYPALLPLPSCAKDAHFTLAEERLWHAEWLNGSAIAPAMSACSAAECSRWFPKSAPSEAAIRTFVSTRSYVRVAARNASDERMFGHVVVLQRPALQRLPHGQTMGPRRAHLRPSQLTSKPASTLGRHAWVEVTRTAFPGEGTRDYGCWFHPAVGSGVFIKVDPKTVLSWVNRTTARQTVRVWTGGLDQGGFRGDGDLPRLAIDRGWSAFEILASHGYTSGFEELGATNPAHELVIVDALCMSHNCPCRIQKHRTCKCQLPSGCVPIRTRTGWNASHSSECECDSETHSEVLNCAASPID